MDYKVEWSSKAVSDLTEHVLFLRKVSKDASSALSADIVAVGLSLSSFPERFPEFPMPSNFPIAIRKCVVNGRYIILYGIVNTSVMIYRILDARKKFDGLVFLI